MCQGIPEQMDFKSTHLEKNILGDKTFRCELCEKSFARKTYLNDHLRHMHKTNKDGSVILTRLNA